MILYVWWGHRALFFFFFKQKTAYEMRISDWSSDVCSSDLVAHIDGLELRTRRDHRHDRRQAHHRGKAVDEMILAAEQDRGAEDSGIGKARTDRKSAV